ncbi:MAG: DNA translocase FtsK 4TM domain-containing protein [Thermodesulfobacteriota bacterium]
MRKEISGIILFFLFLLTLISLLSYSPDDPSVHHARAAGSVQNVFGLLGSHLAGLLIGLFGLGAFWVPMLLLLAMPRLLGMPAARSVGLSLLGGVILMVGTGSLFALRKNAYSLWGASYHAGGAIGTALTDFLTAVAKPTGAFFILMVLILIGLNLALGFSPTRFAVISWRILRTLWGRIDAMRITLQARREKKKNRLKTQPTRQVKETPEIKIQPPPPQPVKEAPKPQQEEFSFMRDDRDFRLPSIKLLNDPPPRPTTIDDENLRMQSLMVEKKLEDFGVLGKVVAVYPGPVITTFEYKPAPGVKINKIVNLTDDLALALRAISIRIVAPIPGKDAIGIEIPNATRETVSFKEIVSSDNFMKSKSKLTLCLGKDIVGNPVVTELDKMPHLLIAGATGAGKSVGLNSMITSLLFKATPEDVRLIMVDPKRIELSVYDGIPHLITPVVTDMKLATNALFWAVREMERRYQLLSEKKARNITQYNRKFNKEPSGNQENEGESLPYIVIIIDELADLMMVASRDVEVALTRLAQMARAAGIHLVLATQRPSVDVLTGVIKANFPTRLSFQVSSKTDSRTILDANGAENLLGSGDMLYLPPGTAKLQRIHGAYISEDEIGRVIEFLKNQKPPEYDAAVIESQIKAEESPEPEEHDERYDEAVALVTKTKQASISMVQRHLRIGYNRAARIIEMMEIEGIVGPQDGVKPREVLVRNYDDM